MSIDRFLSRVGSGFFSATQTGFCRGASRQLEPGFNELLLTKRAISLPVL